MNEFINALYSNARNGRIPEEYDFFGSLIGEWGITWRPFRGNRTKTGKG